MESLELELIHLGRAAAADGTLRALRKKALLSIRDAAASRGVAPSSWLRWETGVVRPGAAHAVALGAWVASQIGGDE